MMNYYSLITDRDTSCQTQTDNAPESLLKKDPYSPFAGSVIDSIRLEKKAKLTDVLSSQTLNLKGHIVSKKVYEILSEFRLHKIQFVDIIDSEIQGYKFMFFNGDLTNQIDYSKSQFKILKSSPLKKSILDDDVPENRDGVLDIYKNVCARSIFKSLVPTKGYHFDESFNAEEYDVFRIGHFDKSFYVSEKVKTKMIEESVSGVEFIKQSSYEDLISA